MKLARRIGLETLGWLLIALGIAGILLPGPGLLPLFAGLVVLSQQYEWAEKRLDPVKYRALKGAAETVETVPRIIVSIFGVLFLAAAGVLWILSPPIPDWWPLSDFFWLPGGLYTGVTLEFSAVFAAATIVYSFRRFYGKPEAVTALQKDIVEADADFHELQDD